MLLILKFIILPILSFFKREICILNRNLVELENLSKILLVLYCLIFLLLYLIALFKLCIFIPYLFVPIYIIMLINIIINIIILINIIIVILKFYYSNKKKISKKEWQIKIVTALCVFMIGLTIKFLLTTFFSITFEDIRTDFRYGIPLIFLMLVIKEIVKDFVKYLEKDNLSLDLNLLTTCFILILLTLLIAALLHKFFIFTYYIDITMVPFVLLYYVLLLYYPPQILWVYIPNYLIFVFFFVLFFTLSKFSI